jgi:alpha-L-fucosidase
MPPLARFLLLLAAPLLAYAADPLPEHTEAPGPVEPTWESLTKNYRAPEWFRDAKFGIWAHWSAQCVPEQGDWYARGMYLQGSKQYDYHVAHYGHPSQFGFMEIDHLWTAEHWEPAKLIELYRRAGAKYFVALANHHDNFDAYDSKYHAWNSVNVGPKKDIVGIWANAARAAGLRFGVSNHSAHAWHWFQAAYGYDAEGPLAGVRYDAARLTRADGKGKWWDGLDPQDLYTGPNIVMPDGLTSTKAQDEWHLQNDRVWNESPPPMNPKFTATWYLRCQDLIDKYHPDLLYFDDTELPLGQTGLDIAAHYYNTSARRNGGRIEAVLNAKKMTPAHAPAVVEDIERGVATGILPEPWQTDTCIGSWHYDRSIFEQHKYKSVGQVVRMLVDIVSKNGNLLLSVPVRGDGTLDEDEVGFLEGMAAWMRVNSEAIFSTRPWTVYGEGPSTVETPEAGHFGGAKDVRSKPYTAEDIRFTTKRGALYAVLLDWPADHAVVIKSLATRSPALAGREITGVSLLGYGGELTWTQDESGLHVTLPAKAPSPHAVALKIKGAIGSPSHAN